MVVAGLVRREHGEPRFFPRSAGFRARSVRSLQGGYCALDKPRSQKGQPVSVSKAKKAVTDYRKAIGRPEGLAELSIFFCEEAFSFAESCSFQIESYFVVLLRMYGQSVKLIGNLPLAERRPYLERLNKLRSRSKHVGYGVQDELNSLWYDANFDEQLE